jgi:hypothetical protein
LKLKSIIFLKERSNNNDDIINNDENINNIDINDDFRDETVDTVSIDIDNENSI